MEIKPIKGNTFCIDTGMSYIPFYKINDEEIILLDSGWATGERKGIYSVIERMLRSYVEYLNEKGRIELNIEAWIS